MRPVTFALRVALCGGLAVPLGWMAGAVPVLDGQAPTRSLAVEGRGNAHVSLAADGAFVAAVWSASRPTGTTDVYAATSRDGGVTFSAPVRVNRVAGDARVNGEQPPRVALAAAGRGQPRIAVVWTTKGEKGTLLRTAQSGDGGRTFTAPADVRDTDAPGNRGWEALTSAPDGRFFTAWLDHRRLAQPQQSKMEGEHQHPGAAAASKPAAAPADGVAMAQLSQLYVGALDGASAPVAVTGGVCYCCKTAIVAAPQNTLFVAWRHVYAGNMRDIAFSASRDGGRSFSAPVRVSEDKWQIDGCPDDGPAMVVAPDGRIHVVWPTVVTEHGGIVKALFHAASRDGRTFSARVRLPARGQANHPQLAVRPDGTLIAAWDESGDGSRKLAFARGAVDGAGRVAFSRQTPQPELGSYPVLAPTPRGMLAAWTSPDGDRSVIKIAEVR